VVVLQGMVMLILATDMARHSEILETFKAKIDKFDFASEDHLNSVRRVVCVQLKRVGFKNDFSVISCWHNHKYIKFCSKTQIALNFQSNHKRIQLAQIT